MHADCPSCGADGVDCTPEGTPDPACTYTCQSDVCTEGAVLERRRRARATLQGYYVAGDRIEVLLHLHHFPCQQFTPANTTPELVAPVMPYRICKRL